MNSWDIASVIIAKYKDKVEEEVFNDLRKAFEDVRSADADARRQKTKADIIRMARLKIELGKFQRSYAKLKTDTGSIVAIDKIISEVQTKIKLISYNKNKKKVT